MAYVWDGKNRVLAIVNEEGIIMNRCIFRILTNKKNGDSVLYREELYPDTIRSDLAEALELFAIERAKAMQLPLLVSESKFDSYAYGDVVSSLYSPAPYEYVDANYTVEENGIFDISSSQVVYTPDIRPKHTSLPSNPKVEEQSLTRAWELWKLKSQSNREQHGYGPGALVVFKQQMFNS